MVVPDDLNNQESLEGMGCWHFGCALFRKRAGGGMAAEMRFKRDPARDYVIGAVRKRLNVESKDGEDDGCDRQFR